MSLLFESLAHWFTTTNRGDPQGETQMRMGNRCGSSPKQESFKTFTNPMIRKYRQSALSGGSSLTLESTTESPYRTAQTGLLEGDFEELCSNSVSTKSSPLAKRSSDYLDNEGGTSFGINSEFALSSKRFRTKRTRSEIELGMAGMDGMA